MMTPEDVFVLVKEQLKNLKDEVDGIRVEFEGADREIRRSLISMNVKKLMEDNRPYVVRVLNNKKSIVSLWDDSGRKAQAAAISLDLENKDFCFKKDDSESAMVWVVTGEFDWYSNATPFRLMPSSVAVFMSGEEHKLVLTSPYFSGKLLIFYYGAAPVAKIAQFEEDEKEAMLRSACFNYCALM